MAAGNSLSLSLLFARFYPLSLLVSPCATLALAGCWPGRVPRWRSPADLAVSSVRDNNDRAVKMLNSPRHHHPCHVGDTSAWWLTGGSHVARHDDGYEGWDDEMVGVRWYRGTACGWVSKVFSDKVGPVCVARVAQVHPGWWGPLPVSRGVHLHVPIHQRGSEYCLWDRSIRRSNWTRKNN